MEKYVCASRLCTNTFTDKKKHNQIYCSNECLKEETNIRARENYYSNKDRLSGKKRLCLQCGVTVLSRYNESNVCSSCDAKGAVVRNNSFTDILNILE